MARESYRGSFEAVQNHQGRQFETLLLLLSAYRDRGINPHGPPSRRETRHQRYRQQQRGDDDMGYWRACRDAKQQPAQQRDVAKASPSPSSNPNETCSRPSPMTIRNICAGLAPIVTRTPISWVRC